MSCPTHRLQAGTVYWTSSSSLHAFSPSLFRRSPTLLQGASGGLGGAGVSMSTMTSRRVLGDARAEPIVIQPSILDESAKMDAAALAQRRQSAVAKVLHRLSLGKGGGDRGASSHSLALSSSPHAVRAAGGEEGEALLCGLPPPPLLSRQWRAVPTSLLSTQRTRQDWFRLMHFNMMVDRWNDYRAAPGTFSALSTTTGSADGMPLALETSASIDAGAPAPLIPTPTPTTTPVVPARIRVPRMLRRQPLRSLPSPENAYEPYDPLLHDFPPYLSREHRRLHLLQLLRTYDPDIVTLNEVQREFFMEDVFKYVRYLGYGALFQSSRGARVRCLRRAPSRPLSTYPVAPPPYTPWRPAARPTSAAFARHRRAPPSPARVQEAERGGSMTTEAYEDIGNVILFHKSRFVPLLSAGDYGKHFHYAHFANLRDRVTNLNLLVACVQLTAGNTALACDMRTHEATQIQTLLDAFGRYDADRSHMSTVICGDFNNEHMDEPCLEVLRRSFFSTYDLAGGPRWTTWHYTEPARPTTSSADASPGSPMPTTASHPSSSSSPCKETETACPAPSAYAGYTTYYRQNVQEFRASHAGSSAHREVRQHVAYRQEAAEMMPCMVRHGQPHRASPPTHRPPPPRGVPSAAEIAEKPVPGVTVPTPAERGEGEDPPGEGKSDAERPAVTPVEDVAAPQANGMEEAKKEGPFPHPLAAASCGRTLVPQGPSRNDLTPPAREEEEEAVYPWTWMPPSSAASSVAGGGAMMALPFAPAHSSVSPPTPPIPRNGSEKDGERGSGTAPRTTTPSSPRVDASASDHRVTASATVRPMTALETIPTHESAEDEEDPSEMRGPKPMRKRTQDFIFYDPNRVALHQLLDVPEDTEVDPEQLLPCTGLPSHHLPLLVDISFNQHFPDVGEMSLKD